MQSTLIQKKVHVMDSISINIDDSILNVFSSQSIDKILNNLNLYNYYEKKQIHSDIIHIVDNNYINSSIGDALITNISNKPIIIKIADCVPILLYDKENKVLAAKNDKESQEEKMIPNPRYCDSK